VPLEISQSDGFWQLALASNCKKKKIIEQKLQAVVGGSLPNTTPQML
jgi:hypothetical protein